MLDHFKAMIKTFTIVKRPSFSEEFQKYLKRLTPATDPINKFWWKYLLIYYKARPYQKRSTVVTERSTLQKGRVKFRFLKT
jgi:hypothetical protein